MASALLQKKKKIMWPMATTVQQMPMLSVENAPGSPAGYRKKETMIPKHTLVSSSALEMRQLQKINKMESVLIATAMMRISKAIDALDATAEK